MATDYDAPRKTGEYQDTETLFSPGGRDSLATRPVSVLDEDDDGQAGFDLADTDLSGADAVVMVVPVQVDEFTCVGCFLIRSRTQFHHDGKLGPVCLDCAA